MRFPYTVLTFTTLISTVYSVGWTFKTSRHEPSAGEKRTSLSTTKHGIFTKNMTYYALLDPHAEPFRGNDWSITTLPSADCDKNLQLAFRICTQARDSDELEASVESYGPHFGSRVAAGVYSLKPNESRNGYQATEDFLNEVTALEVWLKTPGMGGRDYPPSLCNLTMYEALNAEHEGVNVEKIWVPEYEEVGL
jgi:hypothetical protein